MTTSAPTPIAPRILALLDDTSSIARFRAAFGDQLRICNDQVRLVVASREPGVELVIVPTRDRLGQSLATSVSAIRASRQGAIVYIYANRSAESLHALMPLARAGARGVIVRDVDDDARSLRRLLERGSLRHAMDVVFAAAQQVVPARQLPLVLLCLEHVIDPLDAVAFARRLGVSRRTLSAWSARVGARGIRPLTSICRVLVAIEMIRDSGRSIEHVAHAMRFSSSAHLHNTIRRYTGCAPREATALPAAHWCRRFFTVARPASTEKPGASRGMAGKT